MTRRILIIEDDADTRAFIAKGLSESGLTADTAETGRDGLHRALDGGFDAIVLDRMLPELDGLSVVKALRAAQVNTPVLMLTAMGAVDERVNGLKSGADDYLVKPFAFQELLARIETILRRPGETSDVTTLQCCDLEMDLLTRTVRRAGTVIDLKPREFQLLEFFLRHKNRVLTRTMLLEGIWDYHFDPQTNVVDVHVSKLRKKIAAAGGGDDLIRTVRGHGYILSDTAAVSA
ncbi:MAG: response regulator transcription factor [Marinibacterium sp.]